MSKLNAKKLPIRYLKAKFQIASAEETRKLAEAFAPVAEKLFSQASIFNKSRIGLKGYIPFEVLEESMEFFSAGKTVFLKALLAKVLGHDPEYKGSSYTHMKEFTPNLYGLEKHKGKRVCFYDVMRMRHRVKEEKNLLIRLNAMLSSSNIVEWPEADINKRFSCVFEFSLLSEKCVTDEREIDLYTTDEIAAMPEFEQFLEDAAEFRID